MKNIYVLVHESYLALAEGDVPKKMTSASRMGDLPHMVRMFRFTFYAYDVSKKEKIEFTR